MRGSRRKFLAISCCLAILAIVAPGNPQGSDHIAWRTRGAGGGGNFFTVSVHPSNAGIVLMGSDTGGIYRSADGGATWSLRNDGLLDPARFGGYSIQAARFAWDSNNPQNVYYGTLKSSDAGLHWHETVDPHLNATVGVVGPGDVVYAAGYDKVYRTDCAWDKTPGCGASYCTSTLPNGPIVRSLILNPNSSGNHLIACTDKGLFESTFSPFPTCGGGSWTEITKACVGGTNAGKPCSGDPECTGGACRSGSSCVDGANDGLPCTVNGDCTGGTCVPNLVCNDLIVDPVTRTLFLTIGTKSKQDCTGWQNLESWQGGLYRVVAPASGSWAGLGWQGINGAPPGPNLVVNHDFAAGPNGSFPLADAWTNRGNATHASWDSGVGHGSLGSMKLTMDSVEGGWVWSEPIHVTPDTTYRISAWARASYPVTGQSCSFQLSGCSLNASLTLNITWFDIAGNPLPFPNYVVSESGATAAALTSNAPVFGADGNSWREFETLIHVRPQADTLRISLITSGNCSGTTWVDDVGVEALHGLPRVGGPMVLASYGRAVFDSENLNTIYVGSNEFGGHNDPYADTEGVWKSLDGGTNWSLVTNSEYKDNVFEGTLTKPVCGDGICGGRGENCNTCAVDCTPALNPQIPAVGCCGDNSCASTEHGLPLDTGNRYCQVDCPLQKLDSRNTLMIPSYFDATRSIYVVWGLGIGQGAAGHNTLYFGWTQAFKSVDAGGTWTELSADTYINPTSPLTPPPVTSKPRGDTSAVNTYAVATYAGPPPSTETRMYYCDGDNSLQVSTDGGDSFAIEGAPDWGKMTPPVFADGCTSILPDPSDPNVLYVGLSAIDPWSGPGFVGVAKGVYSPSVQDLNRWLWTPLGTGGFPQTGSVDLIQDAGVFYATVFGSGVYILLSPSAQWVNSCSPPSCGNWVSPPDGWETHNIALDPVSHRIYVSAGDPGQTYPQPSAKTGVWASEDAGANWTKISDDPPSGAVLDGEPVLSLLPDGPNTLFVGTHSNRLFGSNEGGLYRGVKNGTWSWTQVLPRPKVSGIALSPFDSSILYAFAGQIGGFSQVDTLGQQAGIWRSLDGGVHWSGPMNYDGPLDLLSGKIAFWANDSHRILVPTLGAGVFEGTITCDEPTIDFACSTRLLASSLPTGTIGTMQGLLADVGPASLDDTYLSLPEGGVNNDQMSAVWTFPNGLSNVKYELRMEGYRTGLENFTVSKTTRNSPPCTGSESYSAVLTINQSSDDDQVQVGDLGKLTGGAHVFCVKITDAGGEPGPHTLFLDRFYAVPTPPSQETFAAADVAGYPIPGTLVSGSFVDTTVPNDTYRITSGYEALKENLVSGKSRLVHTWRFDSVPAGSHKLHIEGYHPASPDGDDFQFSFSPTLNGSYMTISGAVISGTDDTLFGADYSMTGTFSGTVYVRVADTKSNGAPLDTVYIDHLSIRTNP